MGVGRVEAGYFFFDAGADGDGAGAFFGSIGLDAGDIGVSEGGDVRFSDVADVEDLFASEERVEAKGGFFFGSEGEGAEGEVLVEVSEGFFEEIEGGEELFFAFGLLFKAREGVFRHLDIGKDQLEGDDGDIIEGIDAAGDVDDVWVVEAADHLDDGVGLSDVGEELVAEPFAFGGAFDEACDIDEGNGGRNDLFAAGLERERLEARVGHFDDADIGIDGAEGIVFRGDLFASQRVEEGRFADVRKADDSAREVRHDQTPVGYQIEGGFVWVKGGGWRGFYR